MWATIVAKLIGGAAPKVADYYIKKQELKHQRELAKIEGKIAYEKAKTQRAEASEGRDAEWEKLSIQNSGWKDEWVLVLLSIPLVLVFIPQTQPIVMEGFATLEQTPDWYRWLTLMIFAAIYGIRVWRRKL